MEVYIPSESTSRTGKQYPLQTAGTGKNEGITRGTYEIIYQLLTRTTHSFDTYHQSARGYVAP